MTRRCFVALPALASAAPARRETILERARALAEFSGQRTPDAGPETLEQAEAIARGTVFFYGRRPVQVGVKDIDWSGGHVHHHEWPAQLNRFFHLRPLAAAYRKTRDERFARAARAYIEDWLRADPYPAAAKMRPGDNTLTMSARLGSSHHAGWGAALPAFLASPAFDDAFLDRVLDSMSRQAEYLSGRLTVRGNWRISQLDALVFTALRFPFLPNAAVILKIGIAGMREALAGQFLPDGVHIERSPGYHDWMAEVAANYALLPRLFPEADARVDPARVRRALDYGAQAELFGVNDSMAPHADPPRLARLARRGELLRRLDPAAGEPAPPPLEQVFPDAGQIFLRSGWQPGADYIAFDAGGWGSGHTHLSRLSFVFRSGGRVLVADPGILTYEMSDPFGPYGKSTPAHTTLNVNGGNQSGAEARIVRTKFTEKVSMIHARYQGGYWSGVYEWSFRKGRGTGSYGDHERMLFWVKGKYVLVLDSMAADPGAEVRNVWQLGPMKGWTHDAKNLTFTSEHLHLQMSAPRGAEMQCFEGSREPLRGWIGHHGDDAVPAPLVEFRYPAPAVTAVLLSTRPGYALTRRGDVFQVGADAYSF